MRFEQFLSEKASELSGIPNVNVECVSVFESIFDPGDMTNAGTAYIELAEIHFQHGWCRHLQNYLEHPHSVSDNELFSMHVFTHEVMHIRGERNERKADCQAIQRDIQAGVLLGVPAYVARENALRYYNGWYRSHPYFDPECKLRGKLDENLPHSIW